MEGIKKGYLDHSCHQTDPKADIYKGAKKTRLCYGFLGMMKSQGGKCISGKALAAMGRGEIDWAKVLTKGIFNGPKPFIEFHLGAMMKPETTG